MATPSTPTYSTLTYNTLTYSTRTSSNGTDPMALLLRVTQDYRASFDEDRAHKNSILDKASKRDILSRHPAASCDCELCNVPTREQWKQ